jgi:hypothetical protein
MNSEQELILGKGIFSFVVGCFVIPLLLFFIVMAPPLFFITLPIAWLVLKPLVAMIFDLLDAGKLTKEPSVSEDEDWMYEMEDGEDG